MTSIITGVGLIGLGIICLAAFVFMIGEIISRIKTKGIGNISTIIFIALIVGWLCITATVWITAITSFMGVL